MHQPPSPLETLEQMLSEREPNLMRLYLNPHVARACFCLDRYVRETWPAPEVDEQGRPEQVEDHQSFLANGLEEAVGGAIKLVRYGRGPAGVGRTGLILDPSDRLAGFVDAELAGGGCVEFLPGLRVIGKGAFGGEPEWLPADALFDPLVLVAGAEGLLDRHAKAILGLVRRHKPAVITCIDRENLAWLRRGGSGVLREVAPDVVVFDESFVDRSVPFAAFTARRSLFEAWNRPGKSTFHSTTFQPNTISTRHFMNCLASADPDFARRHADDLRAIADDLSRRGDAFRRHYNPSLYRLIRAAGFATQDIRAEGGSVVVDGRPVLDYVGGVACSLRGHNPPAYADEIRSHTAPGGPPPEVELRDRLRALTGLGSVMPAVSGGTAVENALKVALVTRHPRRHVLALKAGFGGKTLLSLTGTSNTSYKQNIGPLYADVHYVDPFAPDAREQVDALFAEHSFAAVQLELIQSVGGVRRIPEDLIRHLDEGRTRWGYLLVVDEVQTGMYRTGPFTMSAALGIRPDLLLLGKGTSDMMFPFSLTLLSDAVAKDLEARAPALAGEIRRRYGYDLGYRTVVNALRSAEELALPGRVAEAGERFARLLRDGLAPSGTVREVRAFGLLIAIELDARSGPRRWLGKRLSAIYLLAMLRHERFPVLAGFCQYEPNTLKITPPLDTSPDDVLQACRTIVDVLGRPLRRVLLAGFRNILMPPPVRKGNHERSNDPAIELEAV
jgi:acetylornithine/succinyldiaminopimelate/putrescine aminotransferase